jgi:hypothetical protein
MLTHHGEEPFRSVRQPPPEELLLVERAMVRQCQIEPQQNRERRVPMKLTDVRYQLVDGRSRQAESESPDHGQTVFQNPGRLGHRVSLSTRAGCGRAVEAGESGVH